MAALSSPLNKLRQLLRRYFTIEYGLENASSARAKDTTRNIKRSRRCYRIPPSERFIWAMVVLIVALVGLVCNRNCTYPGHWRRRRGSLVCDLRHCRCFSQSVFGGKSLRCHVKNNASFFSAWIWRLLIVRGKPWPVEDEKKLKDWVTSGVSVRALVFSFDGQYTKDAIYKKIERLGLEVVRRREKKRLSTTTSLELPEGVAQH